MNLRLLVFVLFVTVAYFFAPSSLAHIHIAPHASSLPSFPPDDPLWPPSPSLCTSCFFALCACIQNMPCVCSFIAPFALFLLPPLTIRPFAPICINLYPSAPIHAIFFIPFQNMMSGEISPAIGPKSWPVRPYMSPACLVFVSPVPPAPQCTHPHPSAPIQTCL